MNFKLRIWRQKNAQSEGKFVDYTLSNVSPDSSFLEMLDLLNEQLIAEGEEPVAFDHDCREGICGMCGVMINGIAHGPKAAVTTCQLHMRIFKDGETLLIEPWRAKSFPVVKDLIVDRTPFDRIVQAGGACVAACPNSSAMLFTAAKAEHLNVLPQGQSERYDRAVMMVEQMEEEGFGGCTNIGECSAVCPKEISMDFIAMLNRDLLRGTLMGAGKR